MGMFPSWIYPEPVTFPIIIYPTPGIATLLYPDIPPDISTIDYQYGDAPTEQPVQDVTGVTYG